MVKAQLENKLDQTFTGTYQFSNFEKLQNELSHFYGFNDASIESYQYQKQTISQLLADLKQLEQKWQKKQDDNKGVDIQEGDYELFKFITFSEFHHLFY